MLTKRNQYIRDKHHLYILQGGPLPVICGVITPINGRVNEGNWGYNPGAFFDPRKPGFPLLLLPLFFFFAARRCDVVREASGIFLCGDTVRGESNHQLRDKRRKFNKASTLPETNSLPLKIDGWKMTFPFGMAYFQGLC